MSDSEMKHLDGLFPETPFSDDEMQKAMRALRAAGATPSVRPGVSIERAAVDADPELIRLRLEVRAIKTFVEKQKEDLDRVASAFTWFAEHTMQVSFTLATMVVGTQNATRDMAIDKLVQVSPENQSKIDWNHYESAAALAMTIVPVVHFLVGIKKLVEDHKKQEQEARIKAGEIIAPDNVGVDLGLEPDRTAVITHVFGES